MHSYSLLPSNYSLILTSFASERIHHRHPFMYKLFVTLLLLAIIIACSGKDVSGSTSTNDGEAIYKKYCTLCHGVNGKLGLNGSKDITVSKLTEAERIVQITKGKNTMTPYEGILSPEEIKAVAAYSMTLK